MANVICVFGDSIAWGAYDPEHGGWVSLLRNHAEAELENTEVYNLGISGETTGGLLRRIAAECAAREPSVVVVAMGINDDALGTPIEQFKDNIRAIVSAARTHAPRVLFIGMTRVDEPRTNPVPWDDKISYNNASIDTYDATTKELCDEMGIRYVDVHSVLSHDDLYDGLHPNTEGHRKLFNAVREVILGE